MILDGILSVFMHLLETSPRLHCSSPSLNLHWLIRFPAIFLPPIFHSAISICPRTVWPRLKRSHWDVILLSQCKEVSQTKQMWVLYWRAHFLYSWWCLCSPSPCYRQLREPLSQCRCVWDFLQCCILFLELALVLHKCWHRWQEGLVSDQWFLADWCQISWGWK